MDATTFGRLIDRYAAALVLYARQWCAAPEDVVQDAFLALMARAAVPLAGGQGTPIWERSV